MRITVTNNYLIGLDQKEEIERLSEYYSRSKSDLVREIIDLGLKEFTKQKEEEKKDPDSEKGEGENEPEEQKSED